MILKKAFTLTELMVVITIIGVLSLVAVPTYRTYVIHSKTAEAYSALDVMSKAEQTCYLENRIFATTLENPVDYPSERTWVAGQGGWTDTGPGQPPYLRNIFPDGAQLFF